MTLIPLITGDQVAFWVCAPLIVILALGVVLARKPVHSALCMAGVMVGLAVLYAAQDAPFLFVVQIIVYTGAILMLFLFVMMLIGVDSTDSMVETLKHHRITSALTALGFGGLLVAAVGQFAAGGGPAGLDKANEQYGGNLEGVAALLFHDYVFLFESVAALLIIGAVGAMLLSHGERLTKKASQETEASERIRRYAEEGIHPGPDPSSGVFARSNAISTPALLPDGSPAPASVSKTLAERGAIVNVADLRAPTTGAFAAIDSATSEAEGEDK